MKKFLKSFATRTALVYGGAAFLILVVGLRTVFLTTTDGEIGFITQLTLGAIFLEFGLLVFYAFSIHQFGDSDHSGSVEVELNMSELETHIQSLNNSIQNLNDSIVKIDNFETEFTLDTIEYEKISNNLITGIDNLDAEIGKNNENMGAVVDSLHELKENIDKHTSQVEKLISGEVRAEIRNEIRDILEKGLSGED
jgi:hypothetical protein|tara:strand:+ start:2106 stop:2693 length:588 start_codon:yes stop_codon:yes gene_type:complete